MTKYKSSWTDRETETKIETKTVRKDRKKEGEERKERNNSVKNREIYEKKILTKVREKEEDITIYDTATGS
jgi:hypothetical protein